MDSTTHRSHAIGLVTPVVSPTELYEVILAACSHNYSQMQASSQRLKQILEMFGTYDALQDIAARPNIPLPVRQQAIIQFKNTVVYHWRSRKLLSDEHRMRIRQRCLYFVNEEDETIAECNEVVVSKLARIDYPNSWPTLISDLLETVDTILQKRYVSMVEDAGETLKLRRSLKLLNGILKEFASVKLPNGMKAMAQIVGQLRVLLYGYYSKMSMTFSPSNMTPQNITSQNVHDNILLSHLVFKCLVKMAVWLWNKIDRLSADEHQQIQSSVEEMFQNSAAQVKALTSMRQTIVLSMLQNDPAGDNQHLRRTISVLTSHIRLFGKFFRRMQQLSHERFVLLPMSGDLIMFYWTQVVESTNYPESFVAGTSASLLVEIARNHDGFWHCIGESDSDMAAYPVRFLVQGITLFKESISQWTPLKRNGMPNRNILSQDFVENAVRLLITRFMSLNPSDLENWMADPEEWVNLEDKENDQWEYEIRACSERLLVQICNQYSEFVVPLLLTMFKEIAPRASVDLASVVHKEALYCAIGRCATRLKELIPFNEWLEHTLASEARDTNPNYPIIKRRIAWLIGKWVSESCISVNDPKIWEVLIHLLQDRAPGTDTVVRLTAAAALRECVDCIDFDANIFAPFLANAVAELISLMSEADTLESKRKVDQSLNTVIEQSGKLILPSMAVITESVPRLWVAVDNDLLFKASLLVTVTKLVEAVKEHSSSLGGLVVPLIRESLAPGVIVYLDVDGLTLWLSALRNTVTMASVNGASALQDMFPQALALLSTNLDLLGSITRIIESHFLLDASHILTAYAINLFQAFLITLQSRQIVDINARELLQSLNLLVQLSPSGLWGEAMHSSGLFSHLLKTSIAGEGDTILLTEHIYLFSRIVLSDRQMFIQLLSASASALGQTETSLYDCLLDQWWGKFDNMSEARHRKLTAMGIASLVSTARPEVLQRLPGEIFNLWLDVFGELREVEDQAALRTEDDSTLVSPDSLIRYWELDKPPDAYFRNSEGTPEYDRRQAVYNQDPIRVTHLVNFVGDRLREAEAICGPAKFHEYLDKTDPGILSQIQAALTRG